MGRRYAGLAALFLAGALVSGITLLHGIQPNDEGLMLRAAARIAGGEVPYRDFWWFYPPGQGYLLGGLWKLFGPSLLTWRILRVACDAAVALLAFQLAGRRSDMRLAWVAWAVAIGAMAFPSGPHPFPIALALALGALLTFERQPLLAGALTGLCAVWRIEFAVYLGLAVLIALSVRDGPRAAVRLLLPAAGVALVLYLPVVIAAGPGDAWRLLVKYPLTDFSDYQGLPFPFHYHGVLDTSSVGAFFSRGAEDLLHFYLPLALVLGFLGSLAALAGRRREPLVIATAIFGVGMAHYLVIRPDLFHTAPLAVLVGVLAAWALAERERRWPELAAAGLAALGVTWALAEGLDRRVRGVTEDTARLHLDVGDGVRGSPREVRELERVVAAIRRRVPRGRPIYVATRRSDRVTSGNPLLYVLAGRSNPTPYDIQAPGVVTSEPVQREIAGDLDRTRTPLVVRWTSRLTAAPEDNRAGRLNGSKLLDGYLARTYRPAGRIGEYQLLSRRRTR